jgi:hypothetical protein
MHHPSHFLRAGHQVPMSPEMAVLSPPSFVLTLRATPASFLPCGWEAHNTNRHFHPLLPEIIMSTAGACRTNNGTVLANISMSSEVQQAIHAGGYPRAAVRCLLLQHAASALSKHQ